MLIRQIAAIAFSLALIDCLPLDRCSGDVGCGFPLNIRIEARSGKVFPDGRYVVDGRADGAPIHVDCQFTAGSSECRAMTGGGIFQGPNGNELWVTVDAAARHVELTVSFEGTVIASSAFDPQYQKSHPNGESCEPTCLVASATITMDSPPAPVSTGDAGASD
jgi:hypothetical protein